MVVVLGLGQSGWNCFSSGDRVQCEHFSDPTEAHDFICGALKFAEYRGQKFS